MLNKILSSEFRVLIIFYFAILQETKKTEYILQGHITLLLTMYINHII